MKKLINCLNLFILLIIFNIFFSQLVLAVDAVNIKEEITNSLNQTGVKSGFGEVTEQTTSALATKIGSVIRIALGFVGVIFLILIIYSGFQWMTAGGNEETVAKAKKRITEAAIGILIIFAAYIITYFITEVLITETNYGQT